ncbi:TonB family protein [Pseudoduganella aquatica]|uniref:TonB family protein n=1 Tax=Pseudoduganella aquatica TaxID=2660641 RepID=A0A7X4KK69_9BURK|nr:TonB family protein [Pseudoduganella aquatica]MYN06834.1 TonB family protein [Pseudoduganella aquatica]
MDTARLKQAAALAVAISTLHGPARAETPAAPAKATRAVADFSKCDKPVWPQEALRREQQGTVTMAFKIGEDGTVVESKVNKSSGYPLLDEAARFGLAKCKFKPGTVGGQPTTTWMQMQYKWVLDLPEKDPALQAAFAEALAAAEGGDPQAQYKVAELIRTGKGVKHDDAQAMAWLKRAAETGYAEAQFMLGSYYLAGKGSEADVALAHPLLMKAAEQGHAMAMMAVGGQYMTGKGVERDPAQGYAWVRKAADAGLPIAYTGLASMYFGGVGVARDPDEAQRMLRRGAELGEQTALQGLGMELLRSQSPRDQAEALPLLEKAAAKGSPVVQYLLGNAYAEGKGTEADTAVAAEWYRKAAAQSYPVAQFALGGMMEQGSGARKDEAEALRLYELAAQRGYLPAVQRMLKVAERGELGRPVDVAAAAQWRAQLSGLSGKK